jgi:SAM-dependent methyltransferase
MAKKIRTSIENLIMQLRGSTWAAYGAKKRTRIVEFAFQYWRARGFPYYDISLAQLRQEYSRLLAKDWHAVFDGRDLRSSNSGLRLANSFQTAMWGAKVNRYRSPIEVFNDDVLLRCAIQRSLTIWPDRFGANASCLRRMLKSYPGAASVSNYRPMIARAIVSKYSPESGQVLDFAAGYGGRLLGTMAAGRSYLGIEPNREQVLGFRKMVDAVKSAGFPLAHVKILNGRAEYKLPKLSPAFADLVFSSPPFFNWEHYSLDHTQSFRCYPEYDLWKARFFEPVIAESFRILKNGGHLALNVTNGKRLPSAEDVKNVAAQMGFRLRSTSRVLFPKLPYLHPRDGNAVKSELLLVFRKHC